MVPICVRVGSLQPLPERLNVDLLDGAWSGQSWKWFPCWAIIRISGMWPLTVFGERVLPAIIPVCRACGAAQVTVAHAFADCPAAPIDFLLLLSEEEMPARECTAGFFQALLRFGASVNELGPRIRFVGTVIQLAFFGTAEREQREHDMNDGPTTA